MEHMPIWGISASSLATQAAAPLRCDGGLGLCYPPYHLSGKGPPNTSWLRTSGLDFYGRDPSSDGSTADSDCPDWVISALLASVSLLGRWENGTTHPGSQATSVRKQENVQELAT